ncbi:MAG TPA: GAP family protein [Gaiellaceae bacterium]|nr:GAP family protein [Gaiellaceae bacterium]
MPSWLEILILAVGSAFWPILILIVVLALRLPHPIRVLVWFLAGALLTTVALGILIVFALQDTSFVTGSHPPANPTFALVAGLLSLLAAYAVLRSSRKAPPPAPAPSKGPSRTERAVERGGPVAFAAGVVLNIVPGALPFVALKDIAQLDASNGAKVAAIVAFYLVMFMFVEVPIVAFAFAPEKTAAVVGRFNAWLGRNARRVAAYVLAAVGFYLTIRGLVQL